MKHHFVIYLLSLSLVGTTLLAQQEKPVSSKKPATKAKTTVAKTASKAPVISKPPTPTKNAAPIKKNKEEEKKPVKNLPVNNSLTKDEIPNEQPSSTTVQQSSEIMKGNKLEDGMKDPKSKRIKSPKVPIEGKEIKFGIRAEGTQAFTLENNVGVIISPGVNVGLLVNLPINRIVSIQPEILFSIVTIKTSTDDNNYVKTSMGNVLVPLMFNFNFGKGTTKFMLSLGGYGNYGLNQSTKVISLGKITKDGLVDLGNNRYDYGLGVGLGTKLNNKFILEARSFYSMKNNINKNGFVTIGLGYLF